MKKEAAAVPPAGCAAAAAAAAPPVVDDRQLLMLMLLNLLCREYGANDGDAIESITKEGVMLSDQSAISRELLIITQRLIDAQLLDFMGPKEGRAAEKSSASAESCACDQQLMQNDRAAAKKKKAAAKKNRNRRNKAKRQSNGMAWLSGAGLIPKMILMAFSSITTLIVALSLVHHSDGSGNLPPALQPTASKPLLRHGQSDHRASNNEASPSSGIISSPMATVTQPPVFSPAAVSVSNSDRIMQSDERALSTCVDTPNWQNRDGLGCDWYQENNDPACLGMGMDGSMGPATENCCICGGGIRSCEDYSSKCEKYFSFLGTQDGIISPICEEAESCSCEDEVNYRIVEDDWGQATQGLYNKCKCDFWWSVCKESGVGLACDYASEYCCGDYLVGEYAGVHDIFYLDSPTCYCDFFTYAQREFGHTSARSILKPQALNVTKEHLNPCDLLEERLVGVFSDEERTRSREVDSLVAIYEQTNGQNWTSNAGWMDDAIDHCQWYGVSCNTKGFVTGIDLRDNNLVGMFPVYTLNPEDFGTEYGPFLTDVENHMNEITWFHSKYGLANLYFLQTVDLADNKLTGTIDFRPLYNLNSLTHFDISSNRLSGEVDVLTTPSISHTNFSNNLFTSMRRFELYKVSSLQALRSYDVSNNNIQNDATDLLENIPPNVLQFVASNNDIYGHLPASLNNLPNLRRFDVSFNALSGKLPEFHDSFMSLEELDMSNQRNDFTGSIPEEVWRFQFLKRLNLAGNKLTGTIPPDIGNMAVLEEFDASNNRLSGRIPSEIGKLETTWNRFDLANNELSGIIPYQVGQLKDASIFLKGNSFDTYASAPLNLCTLVAVKESDIADDVTFCPVERNALSDFYDLAIGAEWTNTTNWMHEYLSHCDWHGVTCVGGRVTELRLVNNNLAGRLSGSIGNLTSMEVLDLSDNVIKGSIPREIGLLSRLTYLRLSYNAFTGEAPDGLAKLTNLQLLQLQSNRITGMPNIPRFEDSIYKESAFVSDCGVPSAFESALECDNCTMCCNAHEDCYPQEETRVNEWGFSYGSFAAVLLGGFTIFCCIVVFLLYRFRKNRFTVASSTMSNESLEGYDDCDEYALSKIGEDSVYSYFVTDKCFGWIIAFVTLGAQVAILVFFVLASEYNLQDDGIDVQFTWLCPRDTDVCSDKSDLTAVGWVMFCILMIAFLAKDMINGSKLIYHSSRTRHPFWSRIRYFVGGWSLCAITFYAFYVSTVYNHAIATSNTEIILNSVVVLFVMDMDETIFAALEAANKKWTAHAAESEDDADTDAAAMDEMKKKIASQDAKIASQQDELMLQKKQMAMLMKTVQKLQESQSQSGAAEWSDSVPQFAATVTASESLSWDAAEDPNPRSDPVAVIADRGTTSARNEKDEEVTC